jgi:hypothetical protein
VSAPTTHDPLVVNTKGGVVWTLRAVSEDGKGWYAPEAVCSCPRFLLTPLSELAASGITGSADVLPVPVGAQPSGLEQVAAEIARFGIYGAAVPATKALVKRADELVTENGSLRARVAELEAERHSTNESLSEAAEALRADRDRIAELEQQTAMVCRACEAPVRWVDSPTGGWWNHADPTENGHGITPKPAPLKSYPPALPWAALMDHEDVSDFLDELAASAITHASSEVALAEVEKTCSTWRLIAEAQHAHNTAPGPDEADGITRRTVPVQALREDEPGACTECGDGPSKWCVGCAKCSCVTEHDPGCTGGAL